MRGWIAAGALLLALFSLTELAYRRRFHAELRRLETRLRDGHPGIPIDLAWWRFEGGPSSPSLAVDLVEAARLRLGGKGRLGSRDALSGTSCYAYAMASAWLAPGFHTFIWSPRRLRFEPWHPAPLSGGPCPPK